MVQNGTWCLLPPAHSNTVQLGGLFWSPRTLYSAGLFIFFFLGGGVQKVADFYELSD